MLCLRPCDGSRLCLPSGIGVSRRYTYKLCHTLTGVFKLQNGVWSKLSLDWDAPLILVMGGARLTCSQETRWTECASPSRDSPTHFVNRSVEEYRLGSGCAVVVINDENESETTEFMYLSCREQGAIRKVAVRMPGLLVPGPRSVDSE